MPFFVKIEKTEKIAFFDLFFQKSPKNPLSSAKSGKDQEIEFEDLGKSRGEGTFRYSKFSLVWPLLHDKLKKCFSPKFRVTFSLKIILLSLT